MSQVEKQRREKNMKDNIKFTLEDGQTYNRQNKKMIILLPELLEENKEKAKNYSENLTLGKITQSNRKLLLFRLIETLTNGKDTYALDLNTLQVHVVTHWEINSISKPLQKKLKK